MPKNLTFAGVTVFCNCFSGFAISKCAIIICRPTLEHCRADCESEEEKESGATCTPSENR